tara:strand:+ start:1845 stop:2345 length:501 start_codon:yes stop_codon:yes gene_type:complete
LVLFKKIMIYLSGRITTTNKIGLMFSYNANHTTKSMLKKNIKYTAVDNGCFSQPDKYTDEGFIKFLKKLNLTDTLFAVAPDVVGDNVATKKRSLPMLRKIRGLGYKAAYVAQDGETPLSVYWDELDCLFIGGTTEWKISQCAAELIKEAKKKISGFIWEELILLRA